MSFRESGLDMQDILQACQDIFNFTQTIESASELQNERQAYLAVIRCLEIIGEAARQMPKSLKEQHPEIPWREVASMRNMIAHEYFGLDVDIVWDIIKTQIPSLEKQVQKIKVD